MAREWDGDGRIVHQVERLPLGLKGWALGRLWLKRRLKTGPGTFKAAWAADSLNGLKRLNGAGELPRSMVRDPRLGTALLNTVSAARGGRGGGARTHVAPEWGKSEPRGLCGRRGDHYTALQASSDSELPDGPRSLLPNWRLDDALVMPDAGLVPIAPWSEKFRCAGAAVDVGVGKVRVKARRSARGRWGRRGRLDSEGVLERPHLLIGDPYLLSQIDEDGPRVLG